MSLKRLPARFYESESGNEPVREWLKKLSKADRTKVGEDIKDVEFGWPVGMPTCQPMGEGLFEVRTNLKKRIARVLFCIHGSTMVLLHGFIKKTEQTPDADLELARDRMKKL
jgi:phage-related protein